LNSQQRDGSYAIHSSSRCRANVNGFVCVAGNCSGRYTSLLSTPQAVRTGGRSHMAIWPCGHNPYVHHNTRRRHMGWVGECRRCIKSLLGNSSGLQPAPARAEGVRCTATRRPDACPLPPCTSTLRACGSAEPPTARLCSGGNGPYLRPLALPAAAPPPSSSALAAFTAACGLLLSHIWHTRAPRRSLQA
jgi:hypothetical protein